MAKEPENQAEPPVPAGPPQTPEERREMVKRAADQDIPENVAFAAPPERIGVTPPPGSPPPDDNSSESNPDD
jgi:hypothetical protein